MDNLILASKSFARQDMLSEAGVEFEAIPADIDERAIEERYSGAPEDISKYLARAKALNVAERYPDSLVIGSDQILEFAGEMLHKAVDTEQARQKLNRLKGNTHRLVSSVCVARGALILWDYTDSASLTMHNFDDAFLDRYMTEAGDALTSCVGAYALEGAGKKLFYKVEGDFHTILGMPLQPLLSYLKEYHTL